MSSKKQDLSNAELAALVEQLQQRVDKLGPMLPTWWPTVRSLRRIYS